MTDFWKAVAAFCGAIVAIFGVLTATGLINRPSTTAAPAVQSAAPGQGTTVVPDLECLNLADATRVLADKLLVVGIKNGNTGSLIVGSAESPAPGSTVARGSAVDLSFYSDFAIRGGVCPAPH